MSALPPPSSYILKKAWKLGQKMAFKDRRLRPDVRGCYQYSTFSLFRTVHRHRLENSDPFIPWDEKLQALVEREASGSGYNLDSPKQWDAFYSHIAAPIRASFWYGWEQVVELEKLYNDEVDAHSNRINRPRVLHVYRPPKPDGVPTALPEGEEQAIWEAVADKIFNELDGDANDQMWNLPDADKVIDRPRQTGT